MNTLRTGLHFASSGSWIGPQLLSWTNSYTVHEPRSNAPLTNREVEPFKAAINKRKKTPEQMFSTVERGAKELLLVGATHGKLKEYSFVAYLFLINDMPLDKLTEYCKEFINDTDNQFAFWVLLYAKDNLNSEKAKLKARTRLRKINEQSVREMELRHQREDEWLRKLDGIGKSFLVFCLRAGIAGVGLLF